MVFLGYPFGRGRKGGSAFRLGWFLEFVVCRFEWILRLEVDHQDESRSTLFYELSIFMPLVFLIRILLI